MIPTTVAMRRLEQQHLLNNQFASPQEAVGWFGAVQSQDYLGAKWTLGLRLHSATDDVIDRAFNDGTLLRTHIMRPTWHFVAPADIRWLLELTAPRVKVKLVTMDRRLALDGPILRRSYNVITDALQGGKQQTRAELGAALANAGIIAEGLRLTHIVMHAELDALLVSGPRRGKQFTYMLLEERAPQVLILKRDEALAELIRRYFRGHGPATLQDFAWWSGLTMADAKAGLAMVSSDVIQEQIDGQTYLSSAALPLAAAANPMAHLLPTFDEFLVGFAGYDQLRRAGHEVSQNGLSDPPLLIDGQVVGTWRRTLKKAQVIVEFAPFATLTAAQTEAIRVAAERYSKFLELALLMP